MPTLTSPGPTVGVVGGGQLGRMMAEAASPLGVELVVLDPTPDCPAALPARDHIVGAFDDEEGIRELARRADVLTFEIELADQSVLARVHEETGTPVHPAPETLEIIHDKLVQKRRLDRAGIPVPPFRRADDAADVRAAISEFGAPVMLKARTGGYDGRGNVPVHDPADAAAALAELGGAAMVESFVDFERELSVIAVQGEGETATFPIGENRHEAEILRETVVPARSSSSIEQQARRVADGVLAELEGRGVFAIELFETADGDVLVNEIAPRPHNSGHWTIEGAVTSQFEQHVRAVLGWPLGATERRGPTAMANVLGDVEEATVARLRNVETVLSTPGAHLHWYGKREVRPLRKMGHVTVAGGSDSSAESVLATARDLRDDLTFLEGE